MHTKSKTLIILSIILFLSVGYKFFMGMQKVSYTIFTEATRYPSNISRDVIGMFCWFLVLERLKSHRCIGSATFWAFIAVLITQIIDYFTLGGTLGAYRLISAPLVYIIVSKWKKT